MYVWVCGSGETVEGMNVYCFWQCRRIGAVFIVDTVDVVKVCPFHSNEPPEVDDETGQHYPDHFEDGHLTRIFSESLLKS